MFHVRDEYTAVNRESFDQVFTYELAEVSAAQQGLPLQHSRNSGTDTRKAQKKTAQNKTNLNRMDNEKLKLIPPKCFALRSTKNTREKQPANYLLRFSRACICGRIILIAVVVLVDAARGCRFCGVCSG